MKKVILSIIISIAVLLSTSINTFAYERDDIVKEYISYLENIDKNVEFAVKNSLKAKEENNTKLIDEYKKSINTVDGEVSRLLTSVTNDYKEYKNDNKISNILLYIGIILSDYKFAIDTLNTYLESDNTDIKYESLKNLFISLSDAERKIDTLKRSN
ncbi:MAG: hypothetical protein ACRDA3_00860 [Peptostreptococcaceae bacterium]